jgi:hypothetical protein
MNYWIAKINVSYPDERSYVHYETIEADERAKAYEMAEEIVKEENEDFADYKENRRPTVYLASLRPYSAFVAVYDCGQGFGGPEEGGWWYDHGFPDEGALNLMKVFTNPREAAEYLGELRAHCQLMNEAEKRYKHSALDTGWYDAFLSFELPEPFPEKTPRYE